MKVMLVEEFDDYDQEYCERCGGEGVVWGEEIATAYDYGWIDDDALYPCPQCDGSGR